MSIVSQASEHTLMKSLHYVKPMIKLKKEKKKKKIKRTNRLIKATKKNNIYIRHLFINMSNVHQYTQKYL